MLRNTEKYYSPNFNKVKRSKNEIKFIIIHYTGMANELKALDRLTNIQSEVSSHYFIKENGKILELVPNLYTAWHAGKSKWGKYKNLNKNSIGIEISNPGHQLNYKKFSNNQIKSLVLILKYLVKKYRINYKNILGHSDIAPERKKDPGEKFPWKTLSRNRLALWHDLDEKKLKKFRLINLSQKEKKIFLSNLKKIGYRKVKSRKTNSNDITLLKAFQRRFRQNLINETIDQECLIISKNLLEI